MDLISWSWRVLHFTERIMENHSVLLLSTRCFVLVQHQKPVEKLPEQGSWQLCFMFVTEIRITVRLATVGILLPLESSHPGLSVWECF